MATYLVKQEHGLNLLRQATLSLAKDMQLDLLCYELTCAYTMKDLCRKIRNISCVLVERDIKANDIIIFEIPSYLTDSIIWTGISQYRCCIINKLRSLPAATGCEIIHVIPVACFPC